MDFDTYQQHAAKTRQTASQKDKSVIVSLLGLAGETGELLSEYKKSIRDGDAHLLHKERVAEELGDLLWYLSDLASQFELSLSTVAERNLTKADERWGQGKQPSTQLAFATAFDTEFPDGERLPRKGTAGIKEVSPPPHRRIETYINGTKMGDNLADNALVEDGYRLHDVFHLACMTLLGWSPVVRRGLRIKRKTDSTTDDVEDGGRAIVIEEGVSALVFSYAIRHNMLEGVPAVDYEILRTIKYMTSHLEVSVRTPRDWQDTILQAYVVWRKIAVNGAGTIRFDADEHQFEWVA
jgi:NTP pyrophosphatase (non-canonical NTP hydrolase)